MDESSLSCGALLHRDPSHHSIELVFVLLTDVTILFNFLIWFHTSVSVSFVSEFIALQHFGRSISNIKLFYLSLSKSQLTTMGDIGDYDFSSGDAGASHVYNEEAGQIRVGG